MPPIENNTTERQQDGRVVSSIGARDKSTEPALAPATPNRDYLKKFGLRQFSWKHTLGD